MTANWPEKVCPLNVICFPTFCLLDGVFTPTFVELTITDVNDNLKKLTEANVNFPFGEYLSLLSDSLNRLNSANYCLVCKPLVAHGSTAAHQVYSLYLDFCFNEYTLT